MSSRSTARLAHDVGAGRRPWLSVALLKATGMHDSLPRSLARDMGGEVVLGSKASEGI